MYLKLAPPQNDPFWTVQSMSQRDLNRAGNQTVCSLQELLRVAVRSNCSVVFNLRRPPPEHPRYQSWVNDTLQAFHRSGISQEQVRMRGHDQQNHAVSQGLLLRSILMRLWPKGMALSHHTCWARPGAQEWFLPPSGLEGNCSGQCGRVRDSQTAGVQSGGGAWLSVSLCPAGDVDP